MIRLKLILLTCLLTLLPAFSAAMDEVRWAITEWEDLTNEDGTGLINEVVDAAFAVSGIKVNRSYVPWRRALRAVERGAADFTGGLEHTEKFLESRYPINQILESVLFHREVISQWSGLDDLKGKKGVWALGYLDEFPPGIRKNMTGEDVSRQSALNMLLEGRADYYFDNRMQMLQTIRKAGTTLESLERGGYSIEPVMEISLFMVFTDSDRGRQVKAAYDQGVASLITTGQLQRIYRKWNMPLPPGIQD